MPTIFPILAPNLSLGLYWGCSLSKRAVINRAEKGFMKHQEEQETQENSPINRKSYSMVLAIAQSPLQLLGVAEWLADYRPESYDLYLVYDPRSIENRGQMEKIVESLNLRTTGEIQNSGISSFFEYGIFIKRAIIKNYDSFVVGGYGSFHQAIVANISSDVFLIDDGNDSLNVQRKMAEVGVNWGLRDRKLKVWRFVLFGLKVTIRDEKRISFYSFLLKKHDNPPRVIQHSLARVKQLLGRGVVINELHKVFFLDTPLVERGFVAAEIIEAACIRAKTFSPDRLVYIPHRGQQRSKSTSLAEKLGLKLMLLELPVETYFLMNSIVPLRVFATTTSAVFSLKALFPHCLFYVFDIRPSLTQHADLTFFNRFYALASENGISVINLES
jgi:hypothetical protein